ncbi:MAG: tRNA dihydrouridine synthase DusB [Candidatus Omnitrophota bacterium]
MSAQPLQLGKLLLDSPCILAPLAGITSFPFRMLNRQFGCRFTFTEMIDVMSLNYNSKKTMEMLRTSKADRPLGIQLLGNDIDYMRRAIDILQNFDFDILDLNAACPQRKVTSKEKGASLLKTPQKLNALLKTMVKYSPVPVTVKIRLGWDSAANVRDIALCVQDAGVCAIIVHGRTKVQMYGGKVDYASIKTVKDSVAIPVIGSGDIFSVQMAQKMFDETGVDGVAVARGALGNPWIFRELNEFLTKGTIPSRPHIDEIVRIMRIHLDMFIDMFGEQRSVVRFRSHFIWYTKGFSHVKVLRGKISKVKTKANLLKVIDEFGSVASFS